MKRVQIFFLRLTLASPAYANVLGGFCVALAGLGVGLEDFTSTIKLYHTLTLGHVLTGSGSVGALLSRYSVKDPDHLKEMIKTLNS